MAPEESSRGSKSGGKSDFTKNFIKKYEEWISDKTKIPVSEEDRVETKSEVPDHEIFGFKNEVKSMENFLLDQKVYKEFKSLVILGEYGVGKTTLCQMIFNNDEVKSVYAPRIWVSMHSKEPKEGLDGKICVLKKILKGLGVEDDMLKSIETEAGEERRNMEEAGEDDGESAKQKELSALLYALHLNLRWKKYLIVFDDVREEDSWDEKLDEKLKEDEKWGKYLSDGFPKGSGGRVIYTTREATLAKKLVAEDHEIHRLWPLTDTHSVWKIYEAVILKEKDKEKEPPRNDKKCIDELMNKSCGLPLAARLLAELDPVFLDDENVAADGQADPANTQPDNSSNPANTQPANTPNPANRTSL